jgi:hypothetical protein
MMSDPNESASLLEIYALRVSCVEKEATGRLLMYE